MNKDRFKFRFYDKQCKMYLPDGHYINGDKWMDDYYEDVYDLPEYIVPEQCTGLRDKNDNLIYEGDIVGFYVYEQDGNWYGGTGAVVWYNSSLGIETSSNFIRFENNIPMANPQGVEIIGNIHEQAKQKDVK